MATRMNADVLLVGSIPGRDAKQAMTLCAQGLGGHLACLPDGETGKRRVWINYLATHTYDGNPGLETLNRPLSVDPDDPAEWRAVGEDWAPRGYEDHWQFRVRDTTAPLTFPSLGYAEAAESSYRVFCDLRAAGVVSEATRFMVAIPLVESGVRPFMHGAEDYPIVRAAYEEALGREIEALSAIVPAADLAVQWDICMEVLAIELNDAAPGLFPWPGPGDVFERYLESVVRASAMVPNEALMGLHLCYGDLGHRHMIEPKDLSVVVRMANAAHEAVERPIDFYHMPIPKERDDAQYVQPLAGLSIGDGKLYLGLVHLTGGVPASLRRLASAKAVSSGFGIATECGFGRRPSESIPELLAIHREVAAAL